MISSIISAILSVIARLILTVIGFFLDIIFSLFGDFALPIFDSSYAQYIKDFWDLCFQFVGWFRSAFCIDTFSWNLIVTMLVIRLTYKPTISIVKMFVEWYNKLKS